MFEIQVRDKKIGLNRSTVGVQQLALSSRKESLNKITSPGLRYMESVKRNDNLVAVQALYEQFDTVDFKEPDGDKIELPVIKEEFADLAELGKILQDRHSQRVYTDKQISIDELSALLKHACGLSKSRKDFPTRTYPSGGAFYSIKLFVYLKSIEGIASGLYLYNPFGHALYAIKKNENELENLINLYFEKKSDCVFLLTHDLSRQFTRYEDLAYKLSLLEAGHLAQNLVLVATALNIQGSPLLAYNDIKLNEAMGLVGAYNGMAYAVEMGK